MPKTIAVLAASLSLALAGAANGGSRGFGTNVTNPWFPLKPGTVYSYIGVKDGRSSREVLRVTHRTKTIQGVPCVVVDDRLWLEGHLAERTSDWYSQDANGNVWYFGEATAELDKTGKVTTTEGSWQSGRDGAKAGILMPAHPRPGQTGVQEHYKGQAEDHFRVLGYLGTNALLVEEWTPLEPGVLDHKMYVRGTGTALERTVKGGDELNELIAVRKS
jgi:hypothetical protein